MTLTLRPAASSDAAVVASLHLNSYKTAYRGLLPGNVLASLDLTEREKRWRGHLADARLRIFLAERDGCVVGFTGVGLSREPTGTADIGELRWLHVAEEWWRQGVGAALHARALDALRDLGCGSARLWTVRGNDRAIAFYEAHGWRADGRTQAVPMAVLSRADSPTLSVRSGADGDALRRTIEGVAVLTDGYTLDCLVAAC